MGSWSPGLKNGAYKRSTTIGERAYGALAGRQIPPMLALSGGKRNGGMSSVWVKCGPRGCTLRCILTGGRMGVTLTSAACCSRGEPRPKRDESVNLALVVVNVRSVLRLELVSHCRVGQFREQLR